MKYKGPHLVSKRDLKEDKFQLFVEKVTAAYYRDKQKFWVIGGVVVLLIVGGIVLLQGGKGGESEAQLRFTEALGMYSQNMIDQAEDAFKAVASRFGKDYVGVKAHYYLGQIYFQTRRFEEAKREFGLFLSKSKNNPVLDPAAARALADCDAELGNMLKAARQYENVYRRYPKWPMAFDAALAAGRAYAEAGALDQAEALYKELLKKEPTGEKAEEVKVQLSFVRTLREKF